MKVWNDVCLCNFLSRSKWWVFLAVSSLEREFMTPLLSEGSAFRQIREAPKRLLSALAVSQMSSV